MSTTTVTFCGTDYELRAPKLLEVMRYKGIREAYRGEAFIALQLQCFGVLCVGYEPPPAANVIEQGNHVAEWLATTHPECTPADMCELGDRALDVFADAADAPARELIHDGEEIAALGNGLPGPLRVGPSWQAPGTRVSGSETLDPCSVT